jgi:hypothetical protein
LEKQGIVIQFLEMAKGFFFSEKCRLVLKTTQRDIQSVLGDYSKGGVKKTTHTYLVLRSIMSGPNPHPAYTIMA